ncbi:hypothetical protein MmiEs2_12590 [Methanimicrococcus stummii]|uniref:Uncharacterized protein n=2 Tax=Methanimicrococcus stummii TaxID=3028294 RepID=A0AA96ZXI3_9EURY|nr:hypothetical protein MmiEs2_12590 [Methanimicrococcus sp. Es2]
MKLDTCKIVSILITAAIIVSAVFLYSSIYPIRHNFSNLENELTDYANGEIQIQVIETKRFDKYTAVLFTDKNDESVVGMAALSKGMNQKWRVSDITFEKTAPIGNFPVTVENKRIYILIGGINCTEPAASYEYVAYSTVDPETYFEKEIEEPNFIDVYNYEDYYFGGHWFGHIKIFDADKNDITEELSGHEYITWKNLNAGGVPLADYLFFLMIAAFGLFAAYVLWKYND